MPDHRHIPSGSRANGSLPITSTLPVGMETVESALATAAEEDEEPMDALEEELLSELTAAASPARGDAGQTLTKSTPAQGPDPRAEASCVAAGVSHLTEESAPAPHADSTDIPDPQPRAAPSPVVEERAQKRARRPRSITPSPCNPEDFTDMDREFFGSLSPASSEEEEEEEEVEGAVGSQPPKDESAEPAVEEI